MQRSPLFRNAFTLVEMSLVLVIVGLLVGAIFAGGALVQQSKLQTIISDYSKYTNAYAQFNRQYGGMPGDLLDATNYWGYDASCPDFNSAGTPGTCNGNNNATYDTMSEQLRAWQQLQLAKLITTNLTGTGGAFTIGTNSPGSRITGAGWMFTTNNTSDVNWYSASLNNLLVFGAMGSGNPYSGILTPSDAYFIDRKIDDGLPATGRIESLKPGYAPTANCATSSVDASARYNDTYTGTACSLIMSLTTN